MPPQVVEFAMSAICKIRPSSVRNFVGDEMDKYLNSQGLVRRSLAGRLDETLFRAVAEIVYHSQTSEEVSAVRSRIREHLEVERKSRRILERSPGPRDHLDLVRSAVASYSLSIVIYRLPNMPPIVMRPPAKCDEHSLVLYLYDMGHKYDLIYTIKKHESLAVAQGILYNDLYCNVFGFSHVDIDGVVGRIRKDAETMGDDDTILAAANGRNLSANIRSVIPYSAAKSIDPSIYRNVPFDLASKFLKKAKTRGNRPGNLKYPQGSSCLARKFDKFESAKVVSVIASDIRLVRFLDNMHASLNIRDLRGRGISYTSVCQSNLTEQSSELNKQRIHVDPCMSSQTLSTDAHFVPLHAQYVATSPTPIIPSCPSQIRLPPTYHANQSTIPSSIEHYLHPESPKCTWWDKILHQTNRTEDQYKEHYLHPQSPKCTWWDKNLHQANRTEDQYKEHYLHPESPKCTWWDKNLRQANRTEDQYETLSSANHSYSLENSHKISGEQDFTPSNNDFNGNLDLMGTDSSSSLCSVCEAPFISSDQQKLVDTAVSFSSHENGSDLPTDINTLRYFFNLGLAAFQDKQMCSLDSLQDICPNSSISESIHDIFALDDEVISPPHMIHVPHLMALGATSQDAPLRKNSNILRVRDCTFFHPHKKCYP